MLTKEDILNEKSLIYYDKGSKNGEDTVEGAVSDVLSAMDEWAKETVFDFLKWMRESGHKYSIRGYWIDGTSVPVIRHTDEQLFNKYLESIKK